MFAIFLIVTVITAVANIGAAMADFVRTEWVLDNMTRLGVPHSRLVPLGTLKLLGGLGLIIGVWLPFIGTLAAFGLTLFFAGAIVTVLRARWWAHLPYPVPMFGLAACALVLSVVTTPAVTAG